MTVVVAVKVYDGVVVAADSAATLPLYNRVTGGPADNQVYRNADKVFHLHRDLPLSLATWGSGGIEGASIAALAKDLRRRLMRSERGWNLSRWYTMAEVCDRVLTFFFDELYSKSMLNHQQPPTGLLISGYGAGERQPEIWEIMLEDPGHRPTPECVMDRSKSGWLARGQATALTRLIDGIGPGLRLYVESIVPEAHQAQLAAYLDNMSGPAVVPAMPFADAIDFARFCAEVTVGYARFTPGADTVAGPIDIAAISRHEGFKWVQRKHYYPPDLNPRRPHDHDL